MLPGEDSWRSDRAVASSLGGTAAADDELDALSATFSQPRGLRRVGGVGGAMGVAVAEGEAGGGPGDDGGGGLDGGRSAMMAQSDAGDSIDVLLARNAARLRALHAV
eukprot:COSAG01_NODE_382_length_17840_cov_68.658663_5_plen_107_part_00